MSGTVLVTGAGGFLGRAVVAEGVRRGRIMRGAVRTMPADSLPGADYVETGDICTADWDAALAGVGCVIHAAARAHVLGERSGDPLSAFRAVNRDATLTLARRAASAGARRFVFVSSIGVNGGETRERPFRADDAPAPHSPYAVAKYEAEQGLRALGAESGLEIVIVRPPLILGKGAKGNLETLARVVRRGLPLPLGSVDANRRDLVSLDSLVDLLLLTVDHPAAAGETLLVSDGAAVATRRLVERIARQEGRRARLLPFPPKALRALLAVAGKSALAAQLLGDLEVDIGRTRSLLGWNPPISAEN
jgi:nucleoside-diphosphate-sugar epimerase